MKVLLITDNHTPSGGAENYFFTLKQKLKDHPEIAVHSLGFGPEKHYGDDFTVFKRIQSHIAKLLWRNIFNPFLYRKLRQEIKRIQPDVIHLHNVKQYSLTVLAAIKSYPVVQTMHDFSYICPTGLNIHKDDMEVCPTGMRQKCFWLHQVKFNKFTYLCLAYSFFILKNRLKKTVKKFIAPSPLLTHYLQHNHFPDAVYLPHFKAEKKTCAFEQINPFHFLYAGNLGMHKGVHHLVSEFAEALQQCPELLLSIAGTGQEERKLHQLVNTLNIDKNVRFLGWQTQLDTLYQECAAIIFPSIGLEAFGLVMSEGMAASRPIIGTNRGTSAWLIDHQKTGLVYDPLKKGDLAAAILKLAGNLPLIKELGLNGAKKLDLMVNNDQVIEQLVGIYKTLL